MNQPTPYEFSRFHVRSKLIGDVVKTRDGQYFKVQNYDTLRIWKTALNTLLTLAFVILGYIALFNYLPEYSIVPTLLLDCLLAVVFLQQLTSRLLYRFARFCVIEPESNGHLIAGETKFPRTNNRLTSVALGVLLLAVFLHSFTFQYIRSQIHDDPRMISAELYADSAEKTMLWFTDDFTGSAPATVRIDEEFFGGRLDLDVTFSRTEALAQHLLVDGRPFGGIIERRMHFNWFWEEDYLHQTYTYFFFSGDYHDGSVVSFTCDGLHREWVFEADEEGA